MDIQRIVSELRQERNRLELAIAALEDGRRKRSRGPKQRGRRRLSAAAKRKIAQGMQRRWAARKRAAGTHGAGQGEP